jgi:hypothetical protein
MVTVGSGVSVGVSVARGTGVKVSVDASVAVLVAGAVSVLAGKVVGVSVQAVSRKITTLKNKAGLGKYFIGIS